MGAAHFLPAPREVNHVDPRRRERSPPPDQAVREVLRPQFRQDLGCVSSRCFSFVYSRLYYTPVASSRPEDALSTIPAPPLDDRDADRTPPSSFLPQPPSSRSSPSPPTPATPSRCARATPRTVPPIRARKTKPPHAGAIRAPRRAAPRSRPRPRAHPDVSPRPSPPPSRGKRRRLTQRNSPNSSHPIPPQPTYPPLFIFAGAPRFRLRLRARRRG